MSIALAPLVALLAVAGSPTACVADSTAPRLDHVIIAVRDLDAASAGFVRHGFRLKPGRLHANGLLNRHIKFRDGTSIELMTVAGTPGDAMARNYAALIAGGAGAVYAALTVAELGGADSGARALGLATLRSGSGTWRFLSFPESSPAAAVFFGAGNFSVQDPDSLVSHDPEVAGLDEVWLEGGRDLATLFEHLGAQRCGEARAPDGRVGTRWALARGFIVIVPMRASSRPRVLGVVLRGPTPGDDDVRPHPALWIRYRSAAP